MSAIAALLTAMLSVGLVAVTGAFCWWDSSRDRAREPHRVTEARRFPV